MMPIPRDTVIEIYPYILGRERESAAVVESKAQQYARTTEARLATLRCKEFANQLTSLGIAKFSREKWVKQIFATGYRCGLI
jgi:hypothetical protein